MKKAWIILLLAALLLSACGGEDFEEFAEEEPVEEFVEPVEEAPASAEEPEQAEPVEAAAGDYEPVFEPGDCPVQTGGYDVQCGYLIVPENRGNPAGASIQLAVAIITPEGGASYEEPIVHLAGGPGQGMLNFLDEDPESFFYYEYGQYFTQILIDQRGTGYSLPTLNCYEVEEAEAGAEIEAEQACIDRLVAEGIDLSAYNSAENAADIADLITTLGYERAHLYGISYGTRLGLTVMRDHPERVASAILDSVYPPNVDTPLEEAPAYWTAISRMLEACASDEACNAEYPDLQTVLMDTVISLDESPLEGSAYSIDGSTLLNDMVQWLYSAEVNVVLMPRLIYELSEGTTDTYDYMVEAGSGASRGRQDDGDVTDSEGMYSTVMCRDEYANGDYTAALEYAESVIPEALAQPLFSSVAGLLMESCPAWGVGWAGAIEDEPVSSDAPVLLLSGHFDPATLSDWGDLAAETLPNSTHVIFPTAGHSVSGWNECANQLISAFLFDPTAELDSSCVEEEALASFVLRDEDLP